MAVARSLRQSRECDPQRSTATSCATTLLRADEMLCYSLTFLALLASVQGRAVNISNTWVLPEEGFPVFYRYFRDRISWYEADAVCQFHHANLVTVDTTAQYDAVRAYLKELDISSAVWVGLIRSNPEGDFTWTDYRGLSGDGYWSSAPDAKAAPLCAAADPTADYRWEARACGGPTVASFICELPVPQWALGNEGCMVRALPALTVLYLPESAAVQLTADCGLAGVKRVQCTGNVIHENLLKDLSCNEEEEPTSRANLMSTSFSWATTTDLPLTEQATTLVTTQEIYTNEDPIKSSTHLPPTNFAALDKTSVKIGQNINKINKIYLEKNYKSDLIQNGNLQNNDIPKLVNSENFLTDEESDKLEDEKHMQHKMLHEELARLGNFEKVFSQSSDHFVPPLVMAKAKISDDMTVLSPEEKHAQKLVEQRLTHNENDLNIIKPKLENSKMLTDEAKGEVTVIMRTTSNPPLPTTTKYNEENYKVKVISPKKYMNKYENPKTKNLKFMDYKSENNEKTTETPEKIMIESHIKELIKKSNLSKTISSNIAKVSLNIADVENSEDDPSIDLTVIIREPGAESEEKIFYSNYSGDVPKMETILNDTKFYSEKLLLNDHIQENMKSDMKNQSMDHLALNHEVIKITLINDNDNYTTSPIIFEATTVVPIFKDEFPKENNETTFSHADMAKTATFENFTSALLNNTVITYNTKTTVTIPVKKTKFSDTSTQTTSGYNNTDIPENVVVSTHATTAFSVQDQVTTTVMRENVAKNITEKSNMDASTIVNSFYPTVSKINDYNFTYNEDDHVHIVNVTDTIDDFQSPLLSAANEPIQRPNRSRRLQSQNQKRKFNPFRILG